MPCTECARIENGIVYLRNEFDFLYGIWLVSSLVWLFHMNTLRCAHIHTHTPAHKMNGHVDVKPLFIQSTVFVLLREGDGRSMGGLNIKTTQWMQSRRIACTRITQSAAPPKKERKIYTHTHTHIFRCVLYPLALLAVTTWRRHRARSSVAMRAFHVMAKCTTSFKSSIQFELKSIRSTIFMAFFSCILPILSRLCSALKYTYVRRQ